MTTAEPPVLELRSVSHLYRGTQGGVRDVTLAVPSQSIYALLGPNGAGKTTLMRLMSGLLPLAHGAVFYFGRPFEQHRRECLKHIGTLIEMPSLYEHLTAREHLRVFAAYTGATPQAIDKALDTVDLARYASTRIRAFSLGMKQRLGVATALLHDPAILILDEPSNGLDPQGIVALRALLRQLCEREGKTIILSSHLLSEVEKLASRVAVVQSGTIRFEGTVNELADAVNRERFVRLRVSSPERAAAILGGREAGGWVEVAGHDAAAAAAVRRLVAEGIDVFEAVIEQPSLERSFVTLLERDRDAS